jgi:hypothetical protein
MTDKLVCPFCGSDAIGTAEKIDGLARATFTAGPDGNLVINYDGGTEVYWDTSTTVGFGCNACGNWETGVGWQDWLLAEQPKPTCVVDCGHEAVDDREARRLGHVDV